MDADQFSYAPRCRSPGVRGGFHCAHIAAHCHRVIRIKDGKVLSDTVNPGRDKPARGATARV